MISVVLNDCRRTWAQKERYMLMVILMGVVVALAFYLNQNQEPHVRIGVINEETKNLPKQKGVEWAPLKNQPSTSQLIMGEYDALLQWHNQEYQLTTLQGKQKNQSLSELLQGYTRQLQEKKIGTASRIIGYLLLFLMMMSLTNLAVLSEDKERKIFKRLATTPTSFGKIIVGHSFFSILSIFIPVMLIIYGEKWFFGTDIGLNFGQYSVLILLITFFATGFSIFLISLFAKGDQANMTGSLILVVTTLLSGSFFSLNSQRKWLDLVIQVLPQKQFLDLTAALENGKSAQVIVMPILYLLLASCFFFCLGIYLIRKDTRQN